MCRVPCNVYRVTCTVCRVPCTLSRPTDSTHPWKTRVEIRALPVRLRLGGRGGVFEAFIVVANMEAIEVSGGVVAPPQRGSDPV
jgi:hypothetical protein